MAQGTIPPMIYPTIVNSLTFQLELMEKEIYFSDYNIRTTWPDFLENHYKPSVTQYVFSYTVGLPFHLIAGLRSMIRSEDAVLEEDQLTSQFITIDTEQLKIIEDLKSRISVNLDQKTGLLTTKVKLPDARASAEMNRHMIEMLKDYITDYRIEKARQNVNFTGEQRDEAEIRFKDTQNLLAEFLDANRNINTARLQADLERLQDERNLAFNIYNSLSQRYEEARIKLQEETPIFKELQPAAVPALRSEPKRGLIVVIFTLLGGIISIGWVLISPAISKFRLSFTP
jgi:uncharacterized protein involved in exopolysaccharide biosynthesis